MYLDANGNPEERVEVGSFVKLLWELGLQTEREYIASIGNVLVADLDSLSLEAACRETLRLMEDGVSLIYQGGLMDEAYVLAERLCQGAPLAVRAVKEVATRSQRMSWAEAVRMGESIRRIVGITEDAQEGVEAFREKRAPEWKGR